jgi:hypothetical protein
MPARETQQCTYLFPWDLVTLSIWFKYDSHPLVKNADVLHRHVDGGGRLHSTRLLTIEGRIPWVFQSFIPAKEM